MIFHLQMSNKLLGRDFGSFVAKSNSKMNKCGAIFGIFDFCVSIGIACILIVFACLNLVSCNENGSFIPLWLLIVGFVLVYGTIVSNGLIMFSLMKPDFIVEYKRTSRFIVILQLIAVGMHFCWFVIGIVNMIKGSSDCYQENVVVWDLVVVSMLALFASFLRLIGVLYYVLS